MLKRIRQYFFNRATKGITRTSRYRSWDNIQTILVLFESDLQEKNQEARDFIKKLQAEGKRVVACFRYRIPRLRWREASRLEGSSGYYS